MRTFTKKREPRTKNVDLFRMISEKFGPSSKIFWKKWTSAWKYGPLPQPENVDRYTLFSEEVDLYLRSLDI